MIIKLALTKLEEPKSGALIENSKLQDPKPDTNPKKSNTQKFVQGGLMTVAILGLF